MKTGRIASEAAREALIPLVDEDIATSAREQTAMTDRAEVDALVDEAERAWSDADSAEVVQVTHRFTDARRARRGRRRTTRRALRTLPARVPGGGEAA